MATSKWTFFRIATLVAIGANIVGGIGWAVANPDQFKEASGVVKTLWGAFVVVAAYFGIRKGKEDERTFAQTMGEPPVQALTWSFTLFSLGALVAVTESHLVRIVPDEAMSAPSFQLALVRAHSTSHADTIRVDARREWSSRIRRGRYAATVLAPAFLPASRTVEVGFFDGLFVPVSVAIADTLRPRLGRLLISGQPDGVRIVVRGERDSTAIGASVVDGPDPVVQEARPGSYWIVGTANGYLSDSIRVNVVADSVQLRSVTLGKRPSAPAVRPGVVAVRPSVVSAAVLKASVILPVAPAGLQVLVNGRLQPETTGGTLRLPPGTYEITVRRRASESLGDRLGYFWEETVTLAPRETRALAAQLPTRALPRLRILDETRGARYALVEGSDTTTIDMRQYPAGVYVLPGRYVVLRTVGSTTVDQKVTIPNDRADHTVDFRGRA